MFVSQANKVFELVRRPSMEGQVIQSGTEPVMDATFGCSGLLHNNIRPTEDQLRPCAQFLVWHVSQRLKQPAEAIYCPGKMRYP